MIPEFMKRAMEGVKALPPKKTDIRETKIDIEVEHKKIARAHQFRVTLNLIAHASEKTCRPKLRQVIERLAGLDWNPRALQKADAEYLYAQVSDAMAEKAKDEFVADLDTIRDLDRLPRGENPDNICMLCGHPHIRWEFDLRNVAGGRDTKTGSTCIEEYGLNVDGYGSAEAALEALHHAIAKAKRESEKIEWQEAHPDHEKTMEAVSNAIGWLKRNETLRPWTLYEGVTPGWKLRVSDTRKKLKAAIDYYREEQFLTPLRTDHVFGDPNLREFVDGLKKELAAASDNIEENQKFWGSVIDKHADNFTHEQRQLVEFLARIGRAPDDLDDDKRAILAGFLETK